MNQDNITIYESEEQTIKFNYPKNEIDGVILAEFLISMEMILQEMKSQYPDCPYAKIVVKTHKEGSFELIYTITEHIQHIDGQQIISVFKTPAEATIYLGGVAFAINQVWDLVTKVKDKQIVNEIDKGDTIEILTDTGDRYIQNKKEYRVYKSPTTKKAINKMFLVLNQESERNSLESIEFKTPNSKPVIFQSEDFQSVYNLTLQKNDKEKNIHELIQQQTLIADGLHLTGNKQWDFFGMEINLILK